MEPNPARKPRHPRLVPKTPPGKCPPEDASHYVEQLGVEKLPPALRVIQVAELLSVSHQTVYRLIACGELAAVRLTPHGTRVLRESLADYLRRNIRE